MQHSVVCYINHKIPLILKQRAGRYRTTAECSIPYVDYENAPRDGPADTVHTKEVVHTEVGGAVISDSTKSTATLGRFGKDTSAERKWIRVRVS
jgi:hypothetical protein